jgi:DNA primase
MDAVTINQQTNLVDLVGGLKRSGRYHVGPCPFCGGRDRFNVKEVDGAQLWICRQCGDGRYQDAVSFLMRRDGVSFTQLMLQFGGNQRPATSNQQPPTRIKRPLPLAEAPDHDWQAAALRAVGRCCENLFSGRYAVWSWLEARGITAEAAFCASLGFNPDWREVYAGCWLPPGVTIPCLVSGNLWYIQVRTTETARAMAVANGRRLDKYHALAGSRLKALYGADMLLKAHTAVICEGEFDALLLRRFLPPGWTAVTMGSAGSLPDNPTWLKYFAGVERAYLVMDNDEAGQTAVSRWRELLPWVTLAAVPEGKDITEYWQAGNDLAAWANSLEATI